MTRSRAPRLARGAVAASVATFVALLSHTAAGGTMPGLTGIVVPWILAVTVSTILAGRTLSLARLGLAVVVSQLLFHTLFVLGVGPRVSEPHNAFHVHEHELATGASVGVVHADLAMWVGHAVAAALTIAALHRGERAVRALLALARETVRTFRRRIAGVAASAPLPTYRAPIAPIRLLAPLSRHEIAAPRRGPPILLPV